MFAMLCPGLVQPGTGCTTGGRQVGELGVPRCAQVEGQQVGRSARRMAPRETPDPGADPEGQMPALSLQAGP